MYVRAHVSEVLSTQSAHMVQWGSSFLFHETQYVVEKKLRTLRPTYAVKDANGNLVGYVKSHVFRPISWFEGTDGPRLGEIRSKRMKYEMYDATNQPKAVVKPASGNRWKSPWLIEDPEDQPLAKVQQSSKLLKEYGVLAPDGTALAQLHLIARAPFLPRGKTPSYRVEILQQNLDPLLILSLFFFSSSFQL